MSTDTIGLICCIIVSLTLTIPIESLTRKCPRGYQPHMRRVVDPIPPSGFGGYQPRAENCPVNPVPPQSVSASTLYHDDHIELDPRLSGRPSGFGSYVPNPWATTNEETIRCIVREELARKERAE